MTTTRSTAPQRLRAAYVRRPHGVRGELRVEPLGGDASRFVQGLTLWSENDPHAVYTVVSARPTPEGDLLLSLGQVVSRNDAEGLRGIYLCVDAGERRRLGDEEWFVWELIGMEVLTVAGDPVGVVSDVEEYAEQEVLVVRTESGRDRRIPMVRAHVTHVDVEVGRITVLPWAEDEG